MNFLCMGHFFSLINHVLSTTERPTDHVETDFTITPMVPDKEEHVEEEITIKEAVPTEEEVPLSQEVEVSVPQEVVEEKQEVVEELPVAEEAPEEAGRIYDISEKKFPMILFYLQIYRYRLFWDNNGD